MKKYKLSVLSLSTFTNITFKSKKLNEHHSFVFNSSHQNFGKVNQYLLELQRSGALEHKVTEEVLHKIESLYYVNKHFSEWSQGDLVIQGNNVTYKGNAVSSELQEFLINAYFTHSNQKGFLNAWSNFLQIITSPNASYKVANRLFNFLNKNDLYITNDGHVLGYKVVRTDYKDKHSGTIDNSVGQVVSVSRSQVDDNDNNTCSYGLHVCSYNYLKDFSHRGEPVMLVKVNPLDIISIPLDYNGEKIRCQKYEVIAELGKWGEDLTPDKHPDLSKVVTKLFTFESSDPNQPKPVRFTDDDYESEYYDDECNSYSF